MQLVEARHRIAGLFFAGQNFSVNCLKVHVVDFGGELSRIRSNPVRHTDNLYNSF